MSTNQKTGIAGEYLAASELSKQGHVVSLTLKNTKSIDLLVSNSTATRVIAVQVKTTKNVSQHDFPTRKVMKDTAAIILAAGSVLVHVAAAKQRGGKTDHGHEHKHKGTQAVQDQIDAKYRTTSGDTPASEPVDCRFGNLDVSDQ